ncbi:MAG TPA: disulfide bond formation protein DsbD, partial [Microscillaceae bacterium]|nr:disulfide bond formation protein DsbD [Microscillaceae bacterium]
MLKPAKWSDDVSKKEVAIGDEVELLFNVEIQADWYLYSTDFDPDLGPQVTEFTFTPHESYALVGKVVPVNPKKKYSDVFGGDYTYFTEKAQFRQKIKILKPNLSIQGKYSYQVCTDKDGRCIPFNANFTFDNLKVVAAKKDDKKTEDKTDKAESNAKDSTTKASTDPTEATKEGQVVQNKNTQSTKSATVQNNVSPESKTGLGWFLVVAFSSGLLALLTPCVFPMIPMTVSYFTKQSENGGKTLQKAIVYGVSIMVIYTIIGVLFSVLFGAGIQNWLSTHWIPNLFFFIVLFAFALSFFGMFELVLPSSWVNSADQQADKGGYYGIFFMAFTLALVSFSCTAPIVGTVLIQAS